MRIRTLVLIVVVICSLAFVILNWSVIAAPAVVSLGFTTVQAAPGVILLGLLLVLSVLYAGLVSRLQRTLLIESRMHAKALEAQRVLAENAEASRFTELRNYLDAALRQNGERDMIMQTALLERLDALQAAFRLALEETGNGTAAQLGELEDRLERAGYRSTPEGIR
jgi:hypothetical protein